MSRTSAAATTAGGVPGNPPRTQPGPPRTLCRPDTDRIVAGVGSGLAIHLGLSVRVVRVVLVALNLVAGAGLMAYVLLWVGTPTGDPEPRPGARRPAAASTGSRSRTPAQLLLVGVALMVAVLAVTVGSSAVALPTFIGSLVPLLAVGLGAIIAWTDLDSHTRRGARGEGGRGFGRSPKRWSLVRVGSGVLIAAAGLVVLVSRGQGLSMAWDVAVATLAVLAGVTLLLAPLMLRFWHRLQDEQTTRIRETERADIAAHLHDSVLQTLALIQRTDDPQRITKLARAQERELRSWLYGGAAPSTDTLAGAVTRVAHEIDDLHGVAVDLVVIGDRPLDDGAQALVRALREALLNAVRHGAPPVSAYVEAGPVLVEAFIRDHGCGFDLQEVPEDRLGVRESILGRMQRHGGSATIRALDEGTEVALSLPVLDTENGAPAPTEKRDPAADMPAGPPATPPAGPAQTARAQNLHTEHIHASQPDRTERAS